jgi:hypothetical protein
MKSQLESRFSLFPEIMGPKYAKDLHEVMGVHVSWWSRSFNFD